MSTSPPYVHGYQPREAERLQDQARTLIDLLHVDTAYPAGSRVLEVGCGVGAQTLALADRSPGANFISIDISANSVAIARARCAQAGFVNVECLQADLFSLPFEDHSFDHVFVCFVLEHLEQPCEALTLLRRLIRPEGTITVIEGDHGTVLMHPESADALAAIQCQVALQQRAGGNALVGRQLYRILKAAGFGDVRVTPRMVYVDGRCPALVDGFTRKTFIAMVEGVREAAISAGLITPQRFDAGVQDLHRTTEAGGMFGYTFFKAVGSHGQA